MSVQPARTREASSKDRLRFWLRAYGAVSAVEREISARLRERFGASLARFDLMAHLYAAPEGLTMGELTRRLLVTGGNTTGLVQRLRREALVARDADPADRRIHRVVLTRQGRDLFETMAEEHETWVNHLFEDLAPEEMNRATLLLDRLRRRLADHPKPSPATSA